MRHGSRTKETDMTETTIKLGREATAALRCSGMDRPLSDYVGNLQADADENDTTYVVLDSEGDLLDVVEPHEPCPDCSTPYGGNHAMYCMWGGTWGGPGNPAGMEVA